MRVTIHPRVQTHTVSRYIYSQFAEHLGRCIYGGIWVGPDSPFPNDGGIRLDVAEALRRLELPCLRWPGGCFADNYDWRDGIGPRERRPRRHNLWWNQPETNQFGTDEFIRLCRLIATEPYICANVGSGTPEQARAWVEYCNSTQDTDWTRRRAEHGNPEPHNVRLWGVGNENWGCGGAMRPEYYADLCRRFINYLRPTAGPGARFIACGAPPELPDWDERFLAAMKPFHGLIDAFALHVYSAQGMSDTGFSDDDYRALIGRIDFMERMIGRACGLAAAYSNGAQQMRVVVDEWGTWFREATVQSGLYQQNTMMDALFAAAGFHMFHAHAERLWITNMAQTVNVLQSLILTRGGDMVLTPTYHVFDLLRGHREGRVVAVDVDGGPVLRTPEGERDAVSVSVTAGGGSELCASLINLDPATPCTVELAFSGAPAPRTVEARRLEAADLHDHNTFEDPSCVAPRPLAPPDPAALELPPRSLTVLRMSEG